MNEKQILALGFTADDTNGGEEVAPKMYRRDDMTIIAGHPDHTELMATVGLLTLAIKKPVITEAHVAYMERAILVVMVNESRLLGRVTQAHTK